MILFYIILSLLLGLVISWLVSNFRMSKSLQQDREVSQRDYNQLDKDFASYKSKSISEAQALAKQLEDKQVENKTLQQKIDDLTNNLSFQQNQVSTLIANYSTSQKTLNEKVVEIETYKKELDASRDMYIESNKQLATAQATNNALLEKQALQNQELIEAREKFNTEFENIANKIFDSKTQKFSDLSKSNLSALLEPLGKNIEDFKRQVDTVYKAESNERFSLSERVKELVQLNLQVSDDTKNLTKALKGEAKTQGRWGEMILERVLEKSGLRKGIEYVMEAELVDDNDKALLSDLEGKKMRPDAIINYPDNRKVIIDSKVSINAYIRMIESDDIDVQMIEASNHIASIKKHINTLSSKGYDDFDKSLDFVLMFIPSEPAFIAALQADSELLDYAYERRIMLISPINLIISLKLIHDLWKREAQNQNALEIANRGGKLYDKFVGFVENLKLVGDYLDKAQGKYSDAYKQLSTGNDNLVLQSEKLRELGVKNKKALPKDVLNGLENDESLLN